MPVIPRIGGFKFWLTSSAALATNDGFNARTLKELAAIVEDNQTVFLEAWNDYFS